MNLWHRFRAFAPVFLIALVTVAVAACGDDDDATNTPTTAGTGGATTAAATATGASQVGGSVDVLGIWGDVELTNFEAMIAPWKQDQGAQVDFTGTRSITTDLNTRVDGGSPPDVAIPAEVGLFQQYASEGKLKPLSDCPGLEEQIRADYPQSFVDLATVDGELYGFFMKADTKGTIFYNPELFTQNNWTPLGDDANFEDLVALSDEIKNSGTVPPWSMGMEAGAGSGFPGTDFIQQVLLNEAGADTYDGIIDGSIPFTDPAMSDAWQKFGQIALTEGYTSQGSAQGIIATNFNDATYVPFTEPPGAAMTYLGAFAEGILRGQFPDIQPATDFDFFTFPGGGATGGANIVYTFNTNPTVCSFLSYMASAVAQQIWVDLGGFTSVNTKIPISSYPGPVAQKAADKLLNAPSFRFDLDDAIGGATQQAIFTGITSYLQDPNSLDTILQNIQSTRP